MAHLPRPKPLKAHNPGLKDEIPSSIPTGEHTPAAVRVAEGIGHEAGHLAHVGASAAKSAGHKAHDILHGIGL